MNCSSKSFQTHAETQICIYEAMIEYCGTMKEIARKFDGKVLNKRFTDALQAASPKTHPFWFDEGKEVPCFYAAFSCDYSRTELCVSLHYLNGNSVSRLFHNRIYGLDPKERGAEWYGNRMDAAKFAELADAAAASMQEKADALRYQIAHFDEMVAKYNEVAKIVKDIPYEFRDMMTYTEEPEFRAVSQLAKCYIY